MAPPPGRWLWERLTSSILRWWTFRCATRRTRLQDGENGGARRHSEDHLQRGEARKEAGAHPALLQGGRQVPAGHAEERLHRGVRDCGRPPRGQDRCRADRTHQQVRRHLAAVRHAAARHGEVGQQPSARTWVRTHRLDDNLRHHGPRGGPPQAHRWQDPRFLLLS